MPGYKTNAIFISSNWDNLDTDYVLSTNRVQLFTNYLPTK